MTEHTHGTSNGYKVHNCRCTYCAAWARVSKRIGDQKRLLDQISEAARTGAAVPISATVTRQIKSTKNVKGQRNEAEQAAADAHEARLRAVQKANQSIAALALLTVAEYSPDFALAARYGRIGLALAQEAGHE